MRDIATAPIRDRETAGEFTRTLRNKLNVIAQYPSSGAEHSAFEMQLLAPSLVHTSSQR
jgi:hypothetical protein